MSDHYDSLSQAQLISLLRKRDAGKKLGLVWERDEIEADAAIDANFIACAIDQKLSDGVEPWRNLVIEGDNFDALRWLRMTYANRVKCIYIDPPYNTGNKDWVYNDRYIGANDRYRHSTWLEFLYRRLMLARDLLSKDGVILVSINDENRAKLELLMDEALPGMRLGCFVWRTRKGGYDSGNFSKDHDFVMVYRNSGFEFAGSEKTGRTYSNPDDDPRGAWTDDPFQQPKNYKQRPGGVYLIRDADNDIYYPPNPNRVWPLGQRGGKGLKKASVEDVIEDQRIIFKKRGQYVVYETLDCLLAAIADKSAHKFARTDLPNLQEWVGKKIGIGSVRIKSFLRDRDESVNPLSSLLDGIDTENSVSLAVGKNQEGTKEILDIFGEQAFNYPKPVSLVRELIRQSTTSGDLVLDFFAGSATTAQAVMELNEEDGGSRQFIMVSSTEATSAEPDKNLCRDVTAERIRRLNAANSGKYAELKAEFAFLRTREVDFDALNAELEPAEAWTALEAMHGLPLTGYDTRRAWNEHGDGDVTLILADRTDDALISRLKDLASARANAFVYSWTPGQLKTALGPVDFEIRPVRETLVKRFQQ